MKKNKCYYRPRLNTSEVYEAVLLPNGGVKLSDDSYVFNGILLGHFFRTKAEAEEYMRVYEQIQPVFLASYISQLLSPGSFAIHSALEDAVALGLI